jgi:hypothetical protein
MRLGGPWASLHVLNKREIACNCQGFRPLAQSLNCNSSGSLKFLYPFLSSPMRDTRYANRNLLELIIFRKQASRTSYEAPQYADCPIVLSIPPSYYQILFLTPVAETPRYELYMLTYQPSDMDSGIQNSNTTVTCLAFISSNHSDKLKVIVFRDWNI